MINEIIKKLPLLKDLNFYTFTLLGLLTIISFLPSLPSSLLDLFDKIEKTYLIQNFMHYEKQVFDCFSIYFAIFFIVILMVLLSSLTTCYFYDWKTLADSMALLGSHFILCIQILHNIRISKFGIIDLFKYYFTYIYQNFYFILPAMGYSFLLFVTFLQIINYFFPRKI